MKKLMFGAVIALMMLAAVPSQLKAADKPEAALTLAPVTSTIPTEAALIARLDEIKAMDKSNLTRSEKKELKSEVKAIRSTQDGVYVGHNHHHGVYYGLGGVLLVVLIVVLIV